MKRFIFRQLFKTKVLMKRFIFRQLFKTKKGAAFLLKYYPSYYWMFLGELAAEGFLKGLKKHKG